MLNKKVFIEGVNMFCDKWVKVVKISNAFWLTSQKLKKYLNAVVLKMEQW